MCIRDRTHTTPPTDTPGDTTRRGALTFDPNPPREEEEDVQLATAEDQAELMHWHYCLGHLSLPSLKAMATNGKIPSKLAKVIPPRCAGCLFGAMTKLPWQGKESKQTHQVYVATKPGKCVSVDQMESSQVGFYAQLKGRLTKKRYTGHRWAHPSDARPVRGRDHQGQERVQTVCK